MSFYIAKLQVCFKRCLGPGTGMQMRHAVSLSVPSPLSPLTVSCMHISNPQGSALSRAGTEAIAFEGHRQTDVCHCSCLVCLMLSSHIIVIPGGQLSHKENSNKTHLSSMYRDVQLTTQGDSCHMKKIQIRLTLVLYTGMFNLQPQANYEYGTAQMTTFLKTL